MNSSKPIKKGQIEDYISPSTQTALDLKLDSSAYNQHFKGVYLTLAALNAAHPTATAGDSAQVNEVGATDVVNYSWDAEDGVWVNNGSGGSGAVNTDGLPEGTSNLYFTTARVLATLLSGLSLVTGGAIVSTDSVLVAFGKLQKQISDNLTAIGLKQDTLVSGNNIRTINGNTLLGSTNLVISSSETATTLGALIGGAADATPNDSDFIATSLTSGGILKKITWTNAKAFLKTYYDTFYLKKSDNFQKNNSSIVDLSLVSSSNSLSPLVTPTSDGSGEAVHPSVLYFKEKWNYYYYWMVITPYNNSDSELENPEILVSNNGIDWSVPTGVTNPLVPSPASGYSADTELVYDYDSNVIWVVYRATISGVDFVKAMSSSNGVTWTTPVDILSSSTFYYASPAVIYEKGIFTLWWVEVAFGDAIPRVIKYKTSTNMLSGWSATTSCTAVFPSEKDIWHLSMRKVNEEYHAFMHVGTAGTDSAIGHELYFATSLDNLTYKLTSSPVIRQGQDANFDKDSIYRGSAIYFPNSNKYTFYYSANTLTGGVRKWRIGYTDIFLDKAKKNNFEAISASQKIHAIHNDKILKIKATVTLTVPFKKLQDDFVCYFDVYTGFTLTLVFDSGNAVGGNSSLVLTENKMAILYKDGSTDNFRLRGDI